MKNKKIIIVSLLLVLFVSIASYKVYSYYWAETKMSTSWFNPSYSKHIYVVNQVFDVLAKDSEDSDGYFLSHGISLNLQCEPDYSSYLVKCSSTFYIENDSTVGIILNFSEKQVKIDNVISSYQPIIDYDNSYIDSDETKTINVSVDIPMDSSGNFLSDEEVYVNDAVSSGYNNVSISFDVKASAH